MKKIKTLLICLLLVLAAIPAAFAESAGEAAIRELERLLDVSAYTGTDGIQAFDHFLSENLDAWTIPLETALDNCPLETVMASLPTLAEFDARAADYKRESVYNTVTGKFYRLAQERGLMDDPRVFYDACLTTGHLEMLRKVMHQLPDTDLVRWLLAEYPTSETNERFFALLGTEALTKQFETLASQLPETHHGALYDLLVRRSITGVEDVDVQCRLLALARRCLPSAALTWWDGDELVCNDHPQQADARFAPSLFPELQSSDTLPQTACAVIFVRTRVEAGAYAASGAGSFVPMGRGKLTAYHSRVDALVYDLSTYECLGVLGGKTFSVPDAITAKAGASIFVQPVWETDRLQLAFELCGEE